uniref:TPR_REGION domain-containing protein n=1 Tax=Onchocerca volvulus TaxID=6282 RepID=A0A8R1TIZ8_ONCVO
MLVSRSRRSSKKSEEKLRDTKIPELDEFLLKHDYIGAMSLIQFQSKDGNIDDMTELWLGHCAFHAGEYRKAISTYEKMLVKKNCSSEINVYIACCLFFLGMYAEAKQYAEKGPKNALQNRLLFHLAYRLKDEKQLMLNHNNLQDIVQDQLSLAAMHYLRSHYQEAIDIYKKILGSKKNFIALNVYLALCYYKLDYYDDSLEVLQIYLNENPYSAVAINLRACNHYKLYNGKTAAKELQKLQNGKASGVIFVKNLISHNTVVFHEGNAALQILPPLIDILPEAKLNLIIFYLKRGDIKAAFNLVRDMNPQYPTEYLLKAITYCIIGYQTKSKEHLKLAQEHFKVVGESATECDTIIGRQAMASSYFLNNQFDEVLVYLNSIKTYFHDDDTFNFNIGQALLACNKSAEAEANLLLIVDEELRNKPAYFLSLARAYIQNGKSKSAWEIYVKIKNSNDDTLKLLSVIANDCYRVGDYLYSARSFYAMEKIEPNPEYWEGKRGAVIGVFKLFVEQKIPFDHLREAMILLEKSNHPQVEHITNIIRRYVQENNLNI